MTATCISAVCFYAGTCACGSGPSARRALEPGARLEPREDLARLGEQRLRLCASRPCSASTLRVLELGHREPERHLELAEPRGRGLEAGLVAGQLRAEAARVRVEQRRPLARTQRLDHDEQLLEPVRVAALERGLERLDDAELLGQERDPELVGREDRFERLERFARLPLRPQNLRLVDAIARPSLDVASR